MVVMPQFSHLVFLAIIEKVYKKKGRGLTVRFYEQTSMVLLHRQFERFTVALLLVFISTSTSEKGSPFTLQFILEATGIAQCLKCGVPSPQSGRGNTTFRTLGLFIYN